MELIRENFRAMIYYDFRRGLSRQECIDQFISTFGDETSSYATVKRWYNDFIRGHYSLTDEFRKGCTKSVVRPENINAVQKLIMQDRHVTYCEIEATLGISSTSIYKILHEHLAVKNTCSRWISHNLTKVHKDARVDWCTENFLIHMLPLAVELRHLPEESCASIPGKKRRIQKNSESEFPLIHEFSSI